MQVALSQQQHRQKFEEPAQQEAVDHQGFDGDRSTQLPLHGGAASQQARVSGVRPPTDEDEGGRREVQAYPDLDAAGQHAAIVPIGCCFPQPIR